VALLRAGQTDAKRRMRDELLNKSLLNFRLNLASLKMSRIGNVSRIYGATIFRA
jgi:hypothetical protein